MTIDQLIAELEKLKEEKGVSGDTLIIDREYEEPIKYIIPYQSERTDDYSGYYFL